jgi:hypothetical protein
MIVCPLALGGEPAVRAAGATKRSPRGALGVYLLGPQRLAVGSTASFRIAVHAASSPRRADPLAGAEVQLALASRAARGQRAPAVALARGRSDASGAADLRFTVPAVASGRYVLSVEVRERALGSARHETPVEIFPGARLLLSSDKKLYQPGQTIHARVLALKGMDLRPLAASPLRMEVRDPKGNAIFHKRETSSRFGIASLDLPLAEEIATGRYELRAWSEGARGVLGGSLAVEVRRYVLPKMRVTVESDRAYYGPRDLVRGTVRAAYLHGKPVAHARYRLEIASGVGGLNVRHYIPCIHRRDGRDTCRLDRDGRGEFEVQLDHGRRGDGELRVVATVTDSAEQRQQGDLARPITSSPLRVELAAENAELVPGVRNRLHVIAAYPDGKPAAGAAVALALGRQRAQGRTDELGVATLALVAPQPRPPRKRARQARDDDAADDDSGEAEAQASSAQLRGEVRDSLGQRAKIARELVVARRGAVLVRPSRALYESSGGQPVELEVVAAEVDGMASGELVYVDVVKSAQTLATFTRRLRGGRATVSFRPSAALFGLLELRAYRLAASGERVGSSRLVYVEHPSELAVRASADRASYRPGETARVSFQVTDARSGDGVEAALGVLAVDDALLVLGGASQAQPKIFFTLADYAWGGGEAPRVTPAGRGLESWIGARGDVVKRGRAVDVLLAAARPIETPLWETNPWQERRDRWRAQAPKLLDAARELLRTHSLGARTPAGWRFASDLAARLAAAGKIDRAETVDPWRRVVRPWHLAEVDPSFVFAKLAPPIAREKLEEIYTRLAPHWTELKLGREQIPKLAARQQPLILPRDLLERMVKAGMLKRSEIVDPWGQPYRVLMSPRLFVNPYQTGLVSRYLIHSAGPDGISGTKDDIGPEGPRRRVHLFGRDTALGSDAADALGGLIGAEIGEAHGVGGLGLVGSGRGGGGTGHGTIGLGSVGTIGHGGGGEAMPARVRSHFPETLLWRPELVTDRAGRASLDVPLADSITTWKLFATASGLRGQLGAGSLDLRVFQDFFVDVDVPSALTVGDRVSVPVTVYNYLRSAQRVTLRLARESWFDPASRVEQTIELRPSEVGMRRFAIVARRAGRFELTVHAAAGRVSDAVRRSVLVEPDGVEHAQSHAGALRAAAAAPAASEHELRLPLGAIGGSERVQLTVHPGAVSQILAGMEGLLRMPHGCFEQTSSTTYPNVLVLDYLRRGGGLTPAIEKRAREYIALGYQRLIGFEVRGGGFSWFGNAPANRILTAYGLMEFTDMSRVHHVDPALIARTQRWLAAQQSPDGSWPPDRQMIFDGAGNNFVKDRLRITAYVGNALRHSGYAGKETTRAREFVRRHAAEASDAYTLAVVADFLAADGGAAAARIAERLWAARRASDKGLYFEGPRSTLTYGAGHSGKLETTALAAIALQRRPQPPPELERVLDTLTASKDSFGAWHSTQATILELRALLLREERSRSRPDGELAVVVDGKLHRTLRLRGVESERSHALDLTRALAGRRAHRVALRFVGQGNVQYQLVGRYWLRRGGAPEPGAAISGPRAEDGAAGGPKSSLAIATRFDRARARPGEAVRLQVEVANRGRQPAEMPLISLALPPAFALDERQLEALVAAARVEKVQRIANRAVLYVSRLGAGQTLRLSLPLVGRHPARVLARPSTVYEYYRPENRAESAAQLLEVR